MSFVSLRASASRISTIFVSAVVGALTLATSLSACKGDDESSNGVNDVKLACQIRVSWKNRRSDDCANCQAAAPRPACGCEAFKGFDGKCEAQGSARTAEASCTTTIDSCTVNCADDCTCLDACYANAQRCRELSSARDGCVAELCAQYCN